MYKYSLMSSDSGCGHMTPLSLNIPDLILGSKDVQELIESLEEHRGEANQGYESEEEEMKEPCPSISSSMSIKFCICEDILQPSESNLRLQEGKDGYEEKDISNEELVEIATLVRDKYVLPFLKDLDRKRKLKRFYIGCSGLDYFTEGYGPYQKTARDMLTELGVEERVNMMYTSLSAAWDEDKMKHFRFLDGDHLDKNVHIRLVWIQSRVFSKIKALLVAMLGAPQYRLPKSSGFQLEKTLEMEEMKEKFGPHCVNMSLGSWEEDGDRTGIIYLVTESSM